jgi:zinc transport system substrate-binding protein
MFYNIMLKYELYVRRQKAAISLTGLIVAVIVSQSVFPQAKRPIEAFTGIPPTAFLVEQIGGERVRVQCLLRPGDNPHTYEPRPRQTAALGRAELYFSSGFPFERSFIRNLADGGAGIRVVRTESGILGSTGKGHDPEKHGTGEPDAAGHEDPHIWLSPALVRIQAETIRGALKARDPVSDSFYEDNLKRFLAGLDTLDRWISRSLAPYRGRAFLVFHPSFGRFAEAYGLRQTAIEMEGKSPSPRQLSAFVQTARSENIRAVFVEPQFESRSAKAVADAIGGRIEWMDPMARDVFGSLRSFTLALVRAFKEADAAAGREPR